MGTTFVLNLPVVRLSVSELREVKDSMSEFLTHATAKSRKQIRMKMRQYRDLVEDHVTEQTGCQYRVRFRRSRGSKTPFSGFFVFFAIVEPTFLGM